jgi:hypothetical protein
VLKGWFHTVLQWWHRRFESAIHRRETRATTVSFKIDIEGSTTVLFCVAEYLSCDISKM